MSAVLSIRADEPDPFLPEHDGEPSPCRGKGWDVTAGQHPRNTGSSSLSVTFVLPGAGEGGEDEAAIAHRHTIHDYIDVCGPSGTSHLVSVLVRIHGLAMHDCSHLCGACWIE